MTAAPASPAAANAGAPAPRDAGRTNTEAATPAVAADARVPAATTADAPRVVTDAAASAPTVADVIDHEAAGGVAADAQAADAATAAPDFSGVVASTSAPAGPVALIVPPTTPMQIGAHAPQAPGLGGAFLALVLVLGLILGLAWLLKRLPGSGFRQADGLRVVASIPLGAKERAAVVQVGGEQLLLGIGAGGVRTLHVLPQPLPEPAPVQMPTLKTLPDFKQLLAQRLRKDT